MLGQLKEWGMEAVRSAGGGVFLLALLLLMATCDCDSDRDVTPPGKANLSIYNVASSSVTLSWTEPGDDAFRGTAYEYDIRFSHDSITESNWYLATPIENSPRPLTPGYTRTHTLMNLDTNTVYHFALKTRDEVPGQWSPLSNSIRAATLPGLGKLVHHTNFNYCYFGGDSPPVVKENVLYALGLDGYVSTLYALDISNAENPAIIGSLPLPYSAAVALDVFGNHAFVGGSRFWVVDIANPQNMDTLSSRIVSGYLTDITIDDTLAYLGVGSIQGFQIYDISDPLSPQAVGIYQSFGLGCYPRMEVAGNNAFMACHGLLSIIDISDPTSPVLQGTYLSCDGSYGSIYEISVAGNLAFLATSTGYGPYTCRLEIIDISDKSSPQRLGFYETVSYLSDAGGIALSGKYLYWTSGAGLTILDISQPASPRFAASCYITGSIATDGNYIYIGALDIFQFTPFN